MTGTNALGIALATVHALSAMLWVGGSSLLLFVVLPAGRATMPLAERVLYFRRLDRAFDSIVYIAVAVLFLSGLLHWLGAGLGAEPRNQALLSVKLVLVIGMLGARLWRSSSIGPELARSAAEALSASEGEPIERLSSAWRGSLRWLALELLLAIPVIVLGVALGR